MSLRHAALGLLSQQPGSGYDLLQRFQLSMAHVWPATQSQLYTELNRLAAEGLIEVTATGPRGRKEYAITEPGRTELTRWLETASVPPPRDADLLKVFLLSALPSQAARQHIADRLDSDKAALAELEELAVSPPLEDADRFSRFALEFGLRFRRMQVEWDGWVLRELDGRSDG